MKKKAIVTGGTKNQFPAIAVLALNIAEVCPNVADELVVFHDGISEKDQEKLKKVFPTRFIKYESPFESVEEFPDVVTKYFSKMVFCKYECFRLLQEYECVIWSDYDFVIYDDISELNNRNDLSLKFLKDQAIGSKFYPALFINHLEYAKKIDLFALSITTPLFVLFDTLPDYLSIYRELIDKTILLTDSLYLPEEAIISLVLNERQLSYEELCPNIYNVTPSMFKNNKSNLKILHSIGQPKFWNGLDNNIWNINYQRWIKEYKGSSFTKKSISNVIKKIVKCITPYGIIRLLK